MTLLFPLGLIALLSLPIIVILHLLRERRRRAVVPSLLLWQNMPRRPDGQRSSVLPVTLLLLLHLLVAALIGVALARPQWLGRLLGSSQQLIVLVDTSTSMGASDGSGTRLDNAISRARSLINGMSARDSAVLINLGPRARLLARGDAESRESLLSALDSLRAGGSGVDLAGALTLAEASRDTDRQGSIVVLTDGALVGQQPPPQPLSAPVTWEQIGSEQPNRAIVTFAAQSRGNGSSAAVQVYARVANYDTAPAQASLELFGDDQRIDQRFVELPAEGESELTWSLPPGHNLLRAVLDGGDALPADDTASLSLAQTRPLRVLLVSTSTQAITTTQSAGRESSELLRRALAALPGLTISTVTATDYAASPISARADLTVFEGVLPQRWPTGGVLVVSPPDNSQLLPVGPPQKLQQAALETEGTLLDGLSLDSLQFGTSRQLTPPPWASVLLAVGDQPLIVRGRTGASEVAVWNFALDQSNLPSRLAFPLLVARTVRDLTPLPLPASLDAGAALNLRPSPRATSVEVAAPDGSTQTLTAAPELSTDTLLQPGIYNVSEHDATKAVLYNGRVAVNAGSAIESNLRSQPEPAFVQAQTTQSSTPGSDGRDLWPWLVLAALLVAVGEWVYVHR